MLTDKEKQLVTSMLEKYNDVLLESMQNAISEDLWNLIVVNRDDKEYNLIDLMSKKEAYKKFVMREFLSLNTSSVVRELKKMDY